jgi:Beta-ketoacyl synthase, C-terminal domain
MVTPVGRDLGFSWAALREGVGPITYFDAGSLPTRIAAKVKGFRLADYLDDVEPWRDHCPTMQFARDDGRRAVRPGRRVGPRPVAVRRLPWRGRGAAGLPPLRRPGAPPEPGWQSRSRLLHPPAPRGAAPDPRARAGAGGAVGAPGTGLRGGEAERQLPDGLRCQRPGDRRCGRDHKILVSSTKSMTGHVVAAGVTICLLASRDGVIPPTINLDRLDDD